MTEDSRDLYIRKRNRVENSEDKENKSCSKKEID